MLMMTLARIRVCSAITIRWAHRATRATRSCARLRSMCARSIAHRSFRWRTMPSVFMRRGRWTVFTWAGSGRPCISSPSGQDFWHNEGSAVGGSFFWTASSRIIRKGERW